MTPEEEPQQDLTLKENIRILFKASKGFWLVNMVNFGDGIAYFGILTLLTRFLGTGLGMSDQLTGISVSAYTGLVTLFMFGGGFVSDKLGVRRALTWSLLVIGIGRILLTGSPTGIEMDGASPLTSGEIKNRASLIVKITDASDPLSKYIARRLSPETTAYIEQYHRSLPSSDDLNSALSVELNQLLRGESLYDSARFTHIELSPYTMRLLEAPDIDKAVLNAALLNDAFPAYLVPAEAKIEITDYRRLAVRLLDNSNPLSLYLRAQLSPSTDALLDEYSESLASSDTLAATLASELNRIIEGPCIFGEHRFFGVELSAKAVKMLVKDPQGKGLFRLNKLLLKEAYSYEIARSRFGVEKAIAWFGLLLMALGTGVMQPALYAGIKEYTDPRTATIGYGMLYSIMNLGIVAETFISPFIRSDAVFLNLNFTQIIGLGWGIDGVYWMCASITGLMLLIHLSFFTRKVELTDRTVIEDEKADKPKLTLKERLKELPFLDPQFICFIFILLPVRTIFAHDFLTMPDYVFRCFPESVSAKYEWIHGMNPLIIVIFVPTIAAFTRKAKIINMMIIGTIITALIPFILIPGPHLWTLLTYVAIYSLGEAVWSSRFLEYVANLAPAGQVGAYMGLAGIPWFLAKFTTGLYSGSMLARFIPEYGVHDSGTLWGIYACVALISPIGLIAARKWLDKGRRTGGAKYKEV